MEKTYQDLLQELAEYLQIATNKAKAAEDKSPSNRDSELLSEIVTGVQGLSVTVSRMREYDRLRKR